MNQHTASTAPSEPRAGQGVHACVLLAGGLRPSPLALATGRNVLDLFVTESRSLLDVWLARLESLGTFPVRIVYGQGVPCPTTPPKDAWPELTVESEPQGFRGPAGVLRDVCAEYPADATLVVGEAGRFVSSDLTELLREHARKSVDATIAVNPDGSPAGVFVIRRSALDCVNRLGFMDLKEQWLNKVLATGGKVVAHELRGQGAMLVRTREGLLDAARVASGVSSPEDALAPVVHQRGSPGISGFSVVCAGARVAAGAIVHDAVVMPGAEVGEDAVVVRSVVAPGVRIENGSEMIDVVAGAGGVRSDRWAASTKRLREER
ncbi:MAG: hypothetical protein ACTS27_06555 [Phycisphaerales bacterium]